MSLYNMIMGVNQNYKLILDFLGFTKEEIGRFRNAWVTDEGRLAIYTRLGGGNRDYYKDNINNLRNHDWFDYDEDDDFDFTYATFYYDVPEEHKEIVDMIAELGSGEPESFKNAIDNLDFETFEEEHPKFVETLKNIIEELENE